MATDVDRRIWADLVPPHPTWFGPLPTWLATARLGIFIHWARTLCRRGRSRLGPPGAVPEHEWLRQ